MAPKPARRPDPKPAAAPPAGGRFAARPAAAANGHPAAAEADGFQEF